MAITPRTGCAISCGVVPASAHCVLVDACCCAVLYACGLPGVTCVYGAYGYGPERMATVRAWATAWVRVGRRTGARAT